MSSTPKKNERKTIGSPLSPTDVEPVFFFFFYTRSRFLIVNFGADSRMNPTSPPRLPPKILNPFLSVRSCIILHRIYNFELNFFFSCVGMQCLSKLI